MAKVKKTPFPPWQTKKPDGIENRYIRLGNSLLCDNVFKSLGDKSKVIYIYMLLESSGKKEFTFPYSKFKNICSKPSFQDVKDELIKKGFISEKQNNKNLRKANIYEFSDIWKKYEPP